MVYLDGDNNLEEAALEDFLEMASVGSTDEVNVIVQMDRIGGYASGYGDWTTTKRFYVTRGMTPDPENGLADLGEVNMGYTGSLQSFVEWAMASYPAQKYGLVIWDHGAGWYPRLQERVFRGVAFDDTDGGDYLSNAEISAVLDTATGGGEYPIEMLGFDACLMAMLEVDTHIAPYVRTRASSEASEPWDGWPYDTILGDLTANPAMTGTALANTIVDRYYASFGNDETQSAVRFGPGFDTLVYTVDDLAATLNRHIETYRTAYTDARSASQEFESDGDYDDFVDLYDFASEIYNRVGDSEVRSAAQAVRNAVDTMVTNEKHGAAWADAHGITIYFPDAYNDWDIHRRDGYLGSAGYQWFTMQSRWDQFLQYYWDGGPQLGSDGAMALPLDVPVAGDASGQANQVEGYGCANRNESGPEDVYTFTLASSTDVTFNLTSTQDLDLFLLDERDEFANCLHWGDVSIDSVSLDPGTYYLIVDGYAWAEGPYELLLTSIFAPAVSISKTVEAAGTTTGVPLGGMVTYTIALHNGSNGVATGVVMTDSLPSGVRFSSWVEQGTAVLSVSDTIQWGPNDVPVDTDHTIRFVTVVTDDSAFAGETITNTASFTSTNAAPDAVDAAFTISGDFFLYLPWVMRSVESPASLQAEGPIIRG
jgi:uncharacterized repeat protein (TIGR01451 family)